MTAKENKKLVGKMNPAGGGKVISMGEYYEAGNQTGVVIIYDSKEMIAFLDKLNNQPEPMDKVVPVYDRNELYFFRKMIVRFLLDFALEMNPGASADDAHIVTWMEEAKLIGKSADLIRANPHITNKQKETLLSNLLFHYKIVTHMSHNSDLAGNPLFVIISFFDKIKKESYEVDGKRYDRTGYPEKEGDFETLLQYYINKYGRENNLTGIERTKKDLLATLDEMEKNFNDEFGASKRMDYAREVDLIQDFRKYLMPDSKNDDGQGASKRAHPNKAIAIAIQLLNKHTLIKNQIVISNIEDSDIKKQYSISSWKRFAADYKEVLDSGGLKILTTYSKSHNKDRDRVIKSLYCILEGHHEELNELKEFLRKIKIT